MTNRKTTLSLFTSKAAVIICALSLSILFFSNSYAADAANGEHLSQTCLGCHGAPGLRNPGPVYNIPMIGGQHASYIESALKAYRSKTRSHGTMQAQASNLTDENILDIAAFFAAMEGNSKPRYVSATLASSGQEKSAVCASCHGATGDGDNDTYPKLGGQYESYIEQALKDYRAGNRQNPIMSGFSATLSIDDIRALSAWFASQQGALSAPQSKIFK